MTIRTPQPRGGQDDSFGAWYATTQPSLARYLLAVTHDRHVAAEICDETMAKACARWERVRKMASPEGWAFRVAQNRLRNSQAAPQQREIRALYDDGRTIPVLDPTADIADQLVLLDAVRKLPRRQMEVVALRYLADQDERTIADILKISRGTVASSLHDALAQLRRRMEAEPGDPSTSDNSRGEGRRR